MAKEKRDRQNEKQVESKAAELPPAVAPFRLNRPTLRTRHSCNPPAVDVPRAHFGPRDVNGDFEQPR